MRKGRPDEKGHRVRHDQDRDCEEHKQDPRHNASTTEKDVDYRGHGIQFRHPSDWSLVEDVGPGETTIAIHSPGTSYWTLPAEAAPQLLNPLSGVKRPING